MNPYVAALFALPSAAFFALCIRAPLRSVPISGICGLLGQYIYVALLVNGEYIAVFTATLFACIICETAARFAKMPCTVLIYPALSPLVPGVMLYRAMLAFSKNNLNDGAIQIICVLAYAGCMAVAMTIASVLAKKVLTPLFAKYGKS